jgi:hypothetical protein
MAHPGSGQPFVVMGSDSSMKHTGIGLLSNASTKRSNAALTNLGIIFVMSSQQPQKHGYKPKPSAKIS